MKFQKCQRILSITLVLALLTGLLPTAAFAATPTAPLPSIYDFKAMRLEDIEAGEVSKFQYFDTLNEFYQGVNFNTTNTWTRLSYTIEKSQNITLSLYEMNEGECSFETGAPGDAWYTRTSLTYDPDSTEPESFLGNRIGTVAGIRILDNVVEGHDPNVSDLPNVTYNKMSHTDWLELIGWATETAPKNFNVIKEDYAFGFLGEKLEIPEPEPEEPINNENAPQEPAPTEVPAPTEESAPTEEPQIDYLPESDVLLNRHSINLFAIDPDERDNVITNYVLWNGYIENDDGDIILPQYEHGKKYVIVLEPTTPEAAIYNSFLAFEVDENIIRDFYCSTQFQEINDYFLENGFELSHTLDPVDLLTGSFSWEYTDFALYGKSDFPFVRYYESADGMRSHGLGLGWSTNYTVELMVEDLYARITLPRGKDIQFNMDYDGTYNPAGDYTLTNTGSGYELKNTMTGAVYYFDVNKQIQTAVSPDSGTIIYGYTNGQLSSISSGIGTFSLSYNSDGNLSTVSDNTGRTTYFEYNGDFLTSVQNADGDKLIYGYTDDGYVSTISNFNGEIYVENQYDSAGRVIHQYAANIGTFDFAYDLVNRHHTCTGTDGYLLEIWYDQHGRIIESANSEGSHKITYNNLFQITSETDREGNTTYYDHDEYGNISSITHPDGTTERYVYNTDRLVTSYTNQNGDTTVFNYDSKGNMLSQTDARGATIQYTYDSKGNLLSLTDAEGALTTYTYDDVGNMLSKTDGNGTTVMSYDDRGRLIAETDPLGNTVNFEYTDAGKLVRMTDAQGNVQTYEVDGNGFNTVETDWTGNRTIYERNTQDQVTKITDPMGGITSYEYDDRGNMTVRKNANGYAIEYSYDAAGRMTSMTDAKGGTWTYSYDNEGRLLSTTDPLGGVISTQYDSRGQVTSETDTRSATTRYVFDGVGNTTEIKDALNNISQMVYDANGNLISETDRTGATTTYSYDKNNRLVEIKDALGNITTYSYDSMGNVKETTSPGGATTSNEYDSLSRKAATKDALGFSTQYEYDILGRISTIRYADGTTTNYTYDANGNVLTSTDQLGGTTTFSYDLMGRVVSQVDPMGGKTENIYDSEGNLLSITDPMKFVTSYTYDANNNSATVTNAEGFTTVYEYDALNRLSTVIDPLGGETKYEYDSEGNLVKLTDAENNTFTYEYDLLGRQTAYTDGRGNRTEYRYDNEGRDLGETDPMGFSTVKSYDQMGRLIAEQDKNGNIRSYSYNADGYMISQTDPLGHETQYEYDELGHLLKTTTALGSITEYKYDSMGRLVSSIDPLKQVTTFAYDELGRVIGTTQKDNSTLSKTYDANGNLLSTTDELGNEISYTYDLDGRMTSTTDALGNKTLYEYDKVGNLIKTTDALGGITLSSYDANGNLLYTTDAENNTTSYTYDKLGRALSVTDPNGGVTYAEYDANGNIIKTIDAEGNATTYVYDARNQVSSYTDPEGYTFSYTYDGNGNVLTFTDGNGNVNHYVYDGLDRAVEKINAEGNSSFNEYDADGRLVKSVNEEGAVTNYTYDALGRLVSLTNALGHATTFEYDVMDRVSVVTDAKGNITRYTYDAAGNVLTETNARGVTNTYTYDANHNLISMTDAAGTVIYTYDALNRVVGQTDRRGNTQWFRYDAVGRITAVRDKNGNLTQYIYDGNGNIIKTIDAAGTEALFTYNANDQMVKMDLHRVDSVNGVDEHEVTLYEYDGRNLIVKEINALSDDTLYIYDGNGNLVSKTDADGYVTQYSYTPLNLVQSINYNDTKQANFQYNKVGELVRMDDWTGTNTFELDLLGQLRKATDHKGYITEYTYDEVGNQTTVKYPDGGEVKNFYDEVYNLTKVQDPDEGVYTYIYDDANRAIELIYPNGWIEENTYDAEGNLIKVMDTDPFPVVKKTVKKYEYKYDAQGNLIWEYKRDTDAIAGLVSCTDYNYDELNRLTGSKRVTEGYPNSNQEITYQYDSLGNLVRETRPENGQPTILTYQYNNLNQMVHKEDCSYISSITRLYDYGYTYDKRGNLVQEEEICAPTTQGPKNITIATYKYDETNKMVSGTNKEGEYSNYTYNGLGVRVGTELILRDNTHGYTDFHCETPSVETDLEGPHGPEVVFSDYVIDYTRLNIDQRVLMEHEVGGYDFRYVYGNDLVNVKVTSDGSDWWGQQIKKCIYSNYVHTDRLGNVVNMSDQFGRVPARIDYDAWGRVTAYDSMTVDGGFRILLPEITYAGHQYDDVLNLFYAKARMYDADNRRFLAMDPVKGVPSNPMTLVQYIYVADNPLSRIDPMGQMNYFTQTGILFEGIGGSLKQQFLDAINIPKAITTIVEIAKALWNGELDLLDLAKAIASGMIEPYVYVVNNVDVLNPFSEATDEAVRAYGDRIGYILVDVAQLILGAKGPQIANYLKNTKVGQKLLGLVEDMTNTKLGQSAQQAITAARRAYNATIDSLKAKTRRYVDTLTCAVWSKGWSARGFDIEKAIKELYYLKSQGWDWLEGKVSNFPVIDVWNQRTRTAVSIKSLDITQSTYSVASKLESKLKEYLNKLAGFQGASNASGSVSNVSTRVLELAIPDVTLTQAQINVINNLTSKAAAGWSYNGKTVPITINISVIPH